MPQSANRIIALSPGTRECGVAVFEELELLYYATKDLRIRHRSQPASGPSGKATQMLEKLIRRYRPSVVVLRQLQPLQRRSSNLVRLTAQLKTITQKRGLMQREGSPKSVRKLLCPDRRATKQATAARLIEFYPELTRYVVGASREQQLYYDSMLDATALGYFYQREAAGNERAGGSAQRR